MALIDESEQAFRELLAEMPATVTFNGIEKPCVSQTLTVKRAQQLHNYVVDASAQITMLATDFEAFEGIVDRQSTLNVNGGDDLVFLTKDSHPNSATIHLFLAQKNAGDA